MNIFSIGQFRTTHCNNTDYGPWPMTQLKFWKSPTDCLIAYHSLILTCGSTSVLHLM